MVKFANMLSYVGEPSPVRARIFSLEHAVRVRGRESRSPAAVLAVRRACAARCGRCGSMRRRWARCATSGPTSCPRCAAGEGGGSRRFRRASREASAGTCPSFSFSCILTWGRLGMRSSRRGCVAAMLGPARRQRKHGPGRATSVSDVQLADELPEVALPGQV